MSGWKQSTGNGRKPALGTRRLPTRARGPGLGLGVCADNGAFSIYFVFYNKEMAHHPPPPPISRGPSPRSEARAQAPGALSSCLSPFGRR